ncbi:TetR/AcrR family transcriptional regulator (plasmid) [Streptomyces sp. BI20]|uniref:TetR/AcrR family transcriptional regulator n=1 Tax=Streptomyces sp. BI20 TaxID=3403460 RepID=UPI003C727922
MGRVSQAQARENRRRVVETASHLFRERGVEVSVAELMHAAGLTHGGFYRQFASKESLVEEALAHALAERAREYEAAPGPGAPEPGVPDPNAEDPAAARRALIDAYLSPEHRDGAADGCPLAAFAGDMARTGDEAARATYTRGVDSYARHLDDPDHDGLARLSTMLGAVLLARATRGTPLSDEILHAAHTALTAPRD